MGGLFLMFTLFFIGSGLVNTLVNVTRPAGIIYWPLKISLFIGCIFFYFIFFILVIFNN